MKHSVIDSKNNLTKVIFPVLALLSAAFSPYLYADEGMWPFNRLNRTALQNAYGFEASPEWLDHVMHSSVRLNSGGSGSFVSSDGLLLTNHHVAASSLYQASTAEQRIRLVMRMAAGFHPGWAAEGGDQSVLALYLAQTKRCLACQNLPDSVRLRHLRR